MLLRLYYTDRVFQEPFRKISEEVEDVSNMLETRFTGQTRAMA